MSDEWVLECSGCPENGTVSVWVMEGRYSTGDFSKALHFSSRAEAGAAFHWDNYFPRCLSAPQADERGACLHSRGKGLCRDCALQAKAMRAVPADAPAVGAPVPHCEHGVAATEKCCACHVKFNPEHCGDARCMTCRTTGADPYPPGDWVSGKEHAVLKGEHDRIAETLRQQNKQIGSLEAALKEATGSKLRVGDLHGTVAALRGDVARLETEAAWLRHENVRLSGKARGSR